MVMFMGDTLINRLNVTLFRDRFEHNSAFFWAVNCSLSPPLFYPQRNYFPLPIIKR